MISSKNIITQSSHITKNDLWKGQPLKKLSFGLNNLAGRNNFGRICSFKKGSRVKRKYRIIDFNRSLLNIPGIIKRIEYDPNRTAYIALICYKNGFVAYSVAVEGLRPGDEITNYNLNPMQTETITFSILFKTKGNSFPLKQIPAGTFVSNIELIPMRGSVFARAAGTFAIVLNKYKVGLKRFVLVKLPSSEEYLVDEDARATIGLVSNVYSKYKGYPKAGVSRNKGRKPTVRGVAMNPVDHPHGGGEGKKSGKSCARTPWGKLCRGRKTRDKLKVNPFIFKKRI